MAGCRGFADGGVGEHCRAMRTLKLSMILMLAALAVPAVASADFQHVVSTGESLTSVAAADGLTVAQLAAANGISPDTQLVAGTAIAIPPQSATGVVTSTASVV